VQKGLCLRSGSIVPLILHLVVATMAVAVTMQRCRGIAVRMVLNGLAEEQMDQLVNQVNEEETGAEYDFCVLWHVFADLKL
jgi:hypothetical protein